MLPKIAIVTATDRRFLPAACCQLLSVAANLPNRGAAELFLITFDVTTVEMTQADEFFHRHQIPVRILAPDLDKKIKTYPTHKGMSPAAYIRLYFDKIFEPHWGRIIYFDADTRVCAPLRPLLEADLAGKPLGAVHDFYIYVTGTVQQWRRTIGLAESAPYFNSGVVIFDWPLTLSSQKLVTARRFVIDHPDRCLKYDQDALNFAFQDAWTPLDPRWNLYDSYFMHGGRLSPYVTHFTGAKPWSRARSPIWREDAKWYREKLRNSPWQDFVERQSPGEYFGLRAKPFGRQVQALAKNSLLDYAPFVLDWLGKERIRIKPPPARPRNSDVERMVQALIREAEGRYTRLRPPEVVLEN